MAFSPATMETIKALAIVFLAILFSRLFIYVLSRYVMAVAKKTRTQIDDEIIEALRKPLYYLIILYGIELALGGLEIAPFLEEVLTSAIFILKVFLGAILVNRLLSTLLNWYGRNIASKTQTRLDDEFLPLFKRALSLFVYITALVIILDYFAYDITAIVAGMGIAGLAVALAAQDTLSNMISGFVIMADRPFRAGDIIELPNKEYGEVYEIGLRSTKILTLDALMIVIPNSQIGSSVILNYSYPDPKLRLRIPIGVAYGSDLDKVTDILIQVGKSESHVLENPAPRVMMISFGDFSLDLELHVWIYGHRDKVAVIDAINRDIDKRFKEEDVEIPFPIQTIYMKNNS